MKSYRLLVWRELTNQKVTSLLTLAAIILSTMMTTVIGQSLGILNTLRQEQASALNGDRYATFHQLTEDQKERLSSDSRLSFAGSLINLGSSEIPSAKLSIWLREYEGDALSVYPSLMQLEAGRLPDSPNEIALPEDALQLLNFQGDLGDSITLPIRISLIRDDDAPLEYQATFKLTGILKSNYIGYVSGGMNSIVGQGTSEQLLPQKYRLYSTDIRISNPKHFQQTVNDIADQYHIPEYRIQYNDILLTTLGIDYDNKDRDNSIDSGSGFPYLTAASVLVGVLVLLASGLVIFNILKIAVAKRIREYGTLRALGADRSTLYLLVCLQLAVLCIAGIPIGIIFGMLTAKGMTIAATGLFTPELFLTSSREELTALIAENSSGQIAPLLISIVVTLLFAYLAALPAARYAAMVPPTIAMSGRSVPIKRRNRKPRRIRSFEAFYARMNMARNRGRTLITILSLFMSITVFVALQSFTSLLDTSRSVQNMHMGDYSLTNETAGFSSEMVGELRSLPGVSSVFTLKYKLYMPDSKGQTPIHTSFALQPGETLHIVGIDEGRLKKIIPTLTEEELQQLREGRACLIKNPVAMSYGSTPFTSTAIANGEDVTVNNVTLKVLGESGESITLDNEGFINGVQIIVLDKVYDKITGISGYSELYPVLSPTADREAIEQAIIDLSEETGGTRWLSYLETDRQLEESYQQIKWLAWGFILCIGIIGILNIMNTVYTNIHTRIKEIGIQRAIGMNEASLYKTFLWEGSYYGIIAAAAGSVAGYVCTMFISAAATEIFKLVPVPVLPILQAASLSIGVCLLATYIPLRQISKKSIVACIDTME
ncbi:ABC transporter permease [Paenibacillus sp. NPDC058071]|uniref:ABC transporter permease n=1 Tax=Paenibacillus sp. NPDC058071 TaxID=3346326 RepID=UPI0036DD1359